MPTGDVTSCTKCLSEDSFSATLGELRSKIRTNVEENSPVCPLIDDMVLKDLVIEGARLGNCRGHMYYLTYVQSRNTAIMAMQ